VLSGLVSSAWDVAKGLPGITATCVSYGTMTPISPYIIAMIVESAGKVEVWAKTFSIVR
jgi:hypothetical protein